MIKYITLHEKVKMVPKNQVKFHSVAYDIIINKEKIKEITKYLFLEAPPRKSDVLLVFGTRHINPIHKTVELYKRGYAKYILFSGGKSKQTGKNEARTMAKEAIKMGISKDIIMIEDKAENTLENVKFSLNLLDKKIGLKNIKSITTITKHFHSRRVLMTLKKWAPKNIKIYPYTYPIYDFTKNNWHTTNVGRFLVFDELEKIKKYLAKGDIKELANRSS